MNVTIFLLLIILAGISNAIMDVLKFRYSRSVFNKFNENWWNPNKSWRNKWKNGDPEQGERFWGSSRWFVRFTDAWHFFQGLMFTSLFLSIVFYETMINAWVDFIMIYLIFTLTFSLFYKKVFIQRSVKPTNL